MKKRIFSVLFALVVALSFSLVTLGPMATPALAAATIVTADTNWSALSPQPTSSDTVEVRNSATLTVDVSNAVCASLQIGGVTAKDPGTVTFSGTNPSLTVSGNVNVGGWENTNRTGTLTFTSGSTLTAQTVTIGGTAATPATGTITMTDGGTLVANALAVGAGSGTWTPGTGTVQLTATSTLPSTIFTSFNNLTISNASVVTLAGPVTVGGDLTIGSGATLNTSAANNYGVTLDRNFTNSGTFTANASAITIGGTGTQSIAGFTTTGGVTVTKTGGTATLQSAMSPGALTMNGVDGTLNLDTGLTHTVTNVTLTNGTLDGGSSTLNVSGTWTGTSGFTASTGTVNYTAAGAQTVGAVTYNNLTLSDSGAKTTTGATVNGILSMEGTATTTGTAPTYGAAATLQYKGSGAQTTGPEWITPFVATGGVVIANTSGNAVTLNAAKVVNAPLTINSGATLATENFALTFGGNFVNNGTFTGGSSNITISGTGTQSIAGFTTTSTVSMTKTAGTATFTGNVNGGVFTLSGSVGTLDLGADLTHTFTGAWTRTAGTLLGNSSTLNIGGTTTNTAGTFTAGTSTVNYNAAGAQTIASVTYNNLTLSGSGIKTTTGATVNGILSMEGTATATGTGTLSYGDEATLQYKGGDTQTTGIEFPETWSGSGGVKINNASGVTLNATKWLGANPLTIGDTVANSVFNDRGFQLTATGILNLTSGTFNLGTGDTATTFPAFTTRNYGEGTTVAFVSGAAQTVAATDYPNLTFSGAGAKNAAGAINVSDNLTNSAVFDMVDNTLTVTGTTTNTGGTIRFSGATNGLAISTGTVEYYGASQTVATGTYNNLTINQSSGNALLGGPVTVNDILKLTSGIITTDANTMIIGSSGSVSGGSSGSYISGNLQKNVATGAQSPTFEVGTASGYNPVDLAFGNVTTAGDLTVKATTGQHPNIGSSTIHSSKNVNVYWSLTSSDVVFDNYSATFNWVKS